MKNCLSVYYNKFFVNSNCNLIVVIALLVSAFYNAHGQSYPIVGTNQLVFFNNSGTITEPTQSQAFYGQDANFPGTSPSFTANGDETVTDNVTGLMWQCNPDLNGNNDGIMEAVDKLTWPEIQQKILDINSNNFAGYNDWRIPTIKELYSLTDWNGTDPNVMGSSTTGLIPFLNSSFFPFAWGDINAGERIIDSQYASQNIYNDLGFTGNNMLFGFNFADGRIKGYDLVMPGGIEKTFSFIAVRGNPDYGINCFIDNGDMTISDTAANLMWTKNDSESAMNWEQALTFAQTRNNENYCSYNDWRLPDVKELQSIVDYSRSPVSSNSASINPVFNISTIVNESGATDWPWFWSSTTHQGFNGTAYSYDRAAYLCFGRAAGWMKLGSNSYYSFVDVHGAGAQRSDPKSGTYVGDYLGVDINGNSVYGKGPQGDVLRVNNYVRLVRNIGSNIGINNETIKSKIQINPNPSQAEVCVLFPREIESIQMYNSTGALISSYRTVSIPSIKLNIKENGIYLIRFKGKNFSFSKKLIISK